MLESGQHGARITLVFLTIQGEGVPAMTVRAAEEGKALQQARCTTAATEEELVRPWTCAAIRLLTSVCVASCHRLGLMTHLSFVHRKPKKIKRVFFVRKW